MFSGFTPIIGYELKPVYIKTTSDRVIINYNIFNSFKKKKHLFALGLI